MSIGPSTANGRRAAWAPPAATRRSSPTAEWLSGGVLSGFVATFAMTLAAAAAFGLAVAAADGAGNRIEQWLAALGGLPGLDGSGRPGGVVVGLHLLLGLGWAVVYARLGEPTLRGAGWWKGLRFAAVPWAVSALAAAALAGAIGAFGIAGPLPLLGSLALHAVYGAVLGAVYGMTADAGFDGAAMGRGRAIAAERGAAVGLVVGAAVGIAGAWILDATMDVGARDAVVLAGAMIGAAGGVGAGSFLGMDDGGRGRPAARR